MPQLGSDQALVDLVETLYEQYYEPLFAYILRLVDNKEQAHDLVQESFLQLHRGRAKLRAVVNRRAWLYRIATNVAFKALRRRSRRWHFTRQLAEEIVSFGSGQTTGIGDAFLSIEHALAVMPPHYRAPLLLHSYYGLSIRETATALALSETAVTTRIYRAKMMFREAYEPGDEGRNEQ